MPRTDIAAAINARLAAIAEYLPDQRGRATFRATTDASVVGLSGLDGVRVVDPQARFSGYASVGQSFSGMAPLGNSPAIVDRSSTLDRERGQAVDTTAMQIFAERLRRGK